jgi:hypothetical protein
MAEVRQKVTGYQFREAIKAWELRKQAATSQFDQSLWAFEGEEKPSPADLADLFVKAEEAIARLQAFQARYNLSVVVDVLGTKMTLCQAVKLMGGAGRHEKMWRSAATSTGGGPFHFHAVATTRKTDEIHARRTVAVEDALARADRATKYASALRSAIALGNSQEREMEVPADLFE